MEKEILYHGSAEKDVTPTYGLDDERHDYGKGFYLTESLDLAKEWSVCKPNAAHGWVRQFELDLDGICVLDFQELGVLAWLAELMKHREAVDSKRYRVLARKFIEKNGVDTDDCDVVKGWRANASYFYIAKDFVRDNIDVELLPELLSPGGLGIQYCIKSEKAFARLHEVVDGLIAVDYAEFNEKYNRRDFDARRKMRELIDSDSNKATRVFSTLFED